MKRVTCLHHKTSDEYLCYHIQPIIPLIFIANTWKSILQPVVPINKQHPLKIQCSSCYNL